MKGAPNETRTQSQNSEWSRRQMCSGSRITCLFKLPKLQWLTQPTVALNRYPIILTYKTLAPSDFFLFPKFKSHLYGCHFENNVIHAVEEFLENQYATFFCDWIAILELCWSKVIDVKEGDILKKWWKIISFLRLLLGEAKNFFKDSRCQNILMSLLRIMLLVLSLIIGCSQCKLFLVVNWCLDI